MTNCKHILGLSYDWDGYLQIERHALPDERFRFCPDCGQPNDFTPWIVAAEQKEMEREALDKALRKYLEGLTESMRETVDPLGEWS